MSREDRKKRTDIKYKGCGGIPDLIDNATKEIWYINDDELDYICEHATDDELYLFTGGDGSITDLKKALSIVDELLERMYNE
jgi:hypothetical protein